MRKLPPIKAVLHAFRSVATYKSVGIQFSLAWTAILFVLGLVGLLTRSPGGGMPGDISPLDFLSIAVGLLAFCSIAVNWHRFVLLDEIPSAAKMLRLDAPVWRYIGNSLLIVLAAAVPILILVEILAYLPPIASLLAVPAAIMAGTFALALSLKLPAIALGRKDFGFKDAFAACQDNFWPLTGVFLINVTVALAATFVLIVIASAVGRASPMLGELTGLCLSMVLNVFYTLFSVSILTSLYGFFVERRDF